MKHPASQHLFAYWNLVRAGRAAPERRDIDPAMFRGILADTLMIDVVTESRPGDMDFPVRLAGTRVNALFGFDIKGRSLPSLWRLPDQAELASVIAAVLDETRPAVAGVQTSGACSDGLALELLLLPLRHQGKTHARLLATLSPAAVPAWLGLRPAAPLTLGPYRMVDPHTSGATAPPRDFSRSRDLGRRHGQFMIYEGGRA